MKELHLRLFDWSSRISGDDALPAQSLALSSRSIVSSRMTSPLIKSLPAFSKLTVMREPTTDCTCPRPQSGLSGCRTSAPGTRVDDMSRAVERVSLNDWNYRIRKPPRLKVQPATWTPCVPTWGPKRQQ